MFRVNHTLSGSWWWIWWMSSRIQWLRRVMLFRNVNEARKWREGLSSGRGVRRRRQWRRLNLGQQRALTDPTNDAPRTAEQQRNEE
jgi:hypothetical protein